MRFKLLTMLGVVTALNLSAVSATWAEAKEGGEEDRPRQREEGKEGERGPKDERGPRGDRGQRLMHAIFQGIELSEEQKSSIKEIFDGFRKERRAWHEEHKDDIDAAMQELKAAKEKKDREAVKAAHDKLHAIHESSPKLTDVFEKFRAVLTGDQLAKFDENIEKLKERMKQHRERRGDGPPPRDDKDGEGRRGGEGAERSRGEQLDI